MKRRAPNRPLNLFRAASERASLYDAIIALMVGVGPFQEESVHVAPLDAATLTPWD